MLFYVEAMTFLLLLLLLLLLLIFEKNTNNFVLHWFSYNPVSFYIGFRTHVIVKISKLNWIKQTAHPLARLILILLVNVI